jgi:hypothetical protein
MRPYDYGATTQAALPPSELLQNVYPQRGDVMFGSASTHARYRNVQFKSAAQS